MYSSHYLNLECSYYSSTIQGVLFVCFSGKLYFLPDCMMNSPFLTGAHLDYFGNTEIVPGHWPTAA